MDENLGDLLKEIEVVSDQGQEEEGFGGYSEEIYGSRGLKGGGGNQVMNYSFSGGTYQEVSFGERKSGVYSEGVGA